MNTVSNLLDELLKVLENDVIRNISLFANGGKSAEDAPTVKFYKHDLPLTAMRKGEESKLFPCVIVRDYGAKIASAADEQINTVRIYMQLIDPSPDMSGYEMLITTIDRVRDYLAENGGIRGKYRLVYPIEYRIADDRTTPYFLGVITTKWSIERKGYFDAEKYL